MKGGGSLRRREAGEKFRKGKISLFVVVYHPVKETNPKTSI